ncbi:hypothetical protein BJX70DRAFT_375797 [Aspergillus crustosus]
MEIGSLRGNGWFTRIKRREARKAHGKGDKIASKLRTSWQILGQLVLLTIKWSVLLDIAAPDPHFNDASPGIRRWIGRDAMEAHRDIRQEEREEPRAEKRQHQWQMHNDPLYHYVPELGGRYDEDEELEERNVADDIMKLIEDNW